MIRDELTEYRRRVLRGDSPTPDELREAAYFFNQPDAMADFQHWGGMTYWTADEALSLSLGRAPERVNWESDVRAYVNISKFAPEYERRKVKFSRAVEAGDIPARGRPHVFIAWGEQRGVPFPHELVKLVPAPQAAAAPTALQAIEGDYRPLTNAAYWRGARRWTFNDFAYIVCGLEPRAPDRLDTDARYNAPRLSPAWKVSTIYHALKLEKEEIDHESGPTGVIKNMRVAPWEAMKWARTKAGAPGFEWFTIPADLDGIEAPQAEPTKPTQAPEPQETAPAATAIPANSASDEAAQLPTMKARELARHFRYPGLDEPAPDPEDGDTWTPENKRLWKEACENPTRYWLDAPLTEARVGRPKAGGANLYNPHRVALAIVQHDSGEELQAAKGMLALLRAQPKPERFGNLAAYWRKRAGDE
jgi:hypothetical protein